MDQADISAQNSRFGPISIRRKNTGSGIKAWETLHWSQLRHHKTSPIYDTLFSKSEPLVCSTQIDDTAATEIAL